MATDVCEQLLLREIDELKREVRDLRNDFSRMYGAACQDKEDNKRKIDELKNAYACLDSYLSKFFVYRRDLNDKQKPTNKKEPEPREYRSYSRWMW